MKTKIRLQSCSMHYKKLIELIIDPPYSPHIDTVRLLFVNKKNAENVSISNFGRSPYDANFYIAPCILFASDMALNIQGVATRTVLK